jgi:hypothetical protein
MLRSSRLRFRNAQPHPPGRIPREDLPWRNAIAAETITIRLSRFGTKEKRARSIHSSARFTCSPQNARNAGPRSLATGWKTMEKFSAAQIARNAPESPRSKTASELHRIDLSAESPKCVRGYAARVSATSQEPLGKLTPIAPSRFRRLRSLCFSG